ncbi:uncharacterized protein LOC62_03G004446 [Vanrija pseudolonga]|uniref:GOLD domain-containing protein n=1 Tax=Vanrija pseudolonga TaxID=143232 RepID=A0AAF0Y6M1_9TREE|nr:hypothetical protein LOC62_03G004446 [Vanrija pseudolonga]
MLLPVLVLAAAAAAVRALDPDSDTVADDRRWAPEPILYDRNDRPGYAVTSPNGWHPAAFKAEYYDYEYTLSGPNIVHLAGLDVTLRLPADAPEMLVLHLNREGEGFPRAFIYVHANDTFNPNMQQLVKNLWPGSYSVSFKPHNLGTDFYPPGKDYFLTLHNTSYHGAVLATSERFDIRYDPAAFTGWTYAWFVAAVAAAVAVLVSVPWLTLLGGLLRIFRQLVMAVAQRLVKPWQLLRHLLARVLAKPWLLLRSLGQSFCQCLALARPRRSTCRCENCGCESQAKQAAA